MFYVPSQTTYHMQRHIRTLHFVLLDCRFIMSLKLRSVGGVGAGRSGGVAHSSRGSGAWNMATAEKEAAKETGAGTRRCQDSFDEKGNQRGSTIVYKGCAYTGCRVVASRRGNTHGVRAYI